MRQKLLNLCGAHFRRVANIVEEDEALDPTYVGFLCSQAVVSGPNGRTHLVEKFRLPFVRGMVHRRISAGS